MKTRMLELAVFPAAMDSKHKSPDVTDIETKAEIRIEQDQSRDWYTKRDLLHKFGITGSLHRIFRITPDDSFDNVYGGKTYQYNKDTIHELVERPDVQELIQQRSPLRTKVPTELRKERGRKAQATRRRSTISFVLDAECSLLSPPMLIGNLHRLAVAEHLEGRTDVDWESFLGSLAEHQLDHITCGYVRHNLTNFLELRWKLYRNTGRRKANQILRDRFDRMVEDYIKQCIALEERLIEDCLDRSYAEYCLTAFDGWTLTFTYTDGRGKNHASHPGEILLVKRFLTVLTERGTIYRNQRVIWRSEDRGAIMRALDEFGQPENGYAYAGSLSETGIRR